MADKHTSGVYPLDELDDFKVSDDDVDPRGWSVYSQDGQKLGEVKELLVDTAAMKVRYLEVEVDREVAAASAGAGDNRRVLFPVGTARLDESDDRVFVSASAASVAGLPAYTRGEPVTRDYENSLRNGFVTAAGTTAGTAAAAGEVTAAELDYYNHDDYDTTRFYGNRARGVGSSSNEQRTTANEADVRTSRGPVTGAATDDVRIGGQEIRMAVNAEEAVIEKRMVVKEEIVIRKRAVTENQIVETDLRTERVDVDRDTGGGTDSDRSDRRPL